MELIGTAGIDDPARLTRSHIYRQVFMNEVSAFEDILPSCAVGFILNGSLTDRYRDNLEKAFVAMCKGLIPI